MYAIVVKTDTVVELVTKQGNYFIDTDSNPYKEEELCFDVPTDRIPIVSSLSSNPPDFGMFTRMLMGNNTAYTIQHGIQLAQMYMTRHPEATGKEVGDFVVEVVKRIKLL